MKIFGIFVFVVVAAAVSAMGTAQQPAPHPYYFVNCVKLKPDMGPEFDKWAADTLHKVAQARIDSGVITTWLLIRAVLPAGKDNECDYQTVSFYPGIPAKPLEAAEMDELMKKAGLTVEQYRQSRNAVSELATTGMFQMVVKTGTVQKGDYLSLGYLKVKEPAILNAQKWIDFETKVWKPISELLIEKGITRGWSVDSRMLPDGAALPFDGLTVDVYPSWEALFKLQDDPNFPEYWKKVHPDMDFEATFEEYEKYRTVVREELWVVQDMIASKPMAGHR